MPISAEGIQASQGFKDFLATEQGRNLGEKRATKIILALLEEFGGEETSDSTLPFILSLLAEATAGQLRDLLSSESKAQHSESLARSEEDVLKEKWKVEVVPHFTRAFGLHVDDLSFDPRNPEKADGVTVDQIPRIREKIEEIVLSLAESKNLKALHQIAAPSQNKLSELGMQIVQGMINQLSVFHFELKTTKQSAINKYSGRTEVTLIIKNPWRCTTQMAEVVIRKIAKAAIELIQKKTKGQEAAAQPETKAERLFGQEQGNQATLLRRQFECLLDSLLRISGKPVLSSFYLGKTIIGKALISWESALAKFGILIDFDRDENRKPNWQTGTVWCTQLPGTKEEIRTAIQAAYVRMGGIFHAVEEEVVNDAPTTSTHYDAYRPWLS